MCTPFFFFIQNLLSYHLAVRVPWSEIFAKVVDLQKDFQLEHALVAENTLEDIFLNFAKAQEQQQASYSHSASSTARSTATHTTGTTSATA